MMPCKRCGSLERHPPLKGRKTGRCKSCQKARNVHRPSKAESATSLAEQYKWLGMARGLTVQEWERERGLPPYSVFPEARSADSFVEVGFYMYRNATVEERLNMQRARI
jgi:hypothetical protein